VIGSVFPGRRIESPCYAVAVPEKKYRGDRHGSAENVEIKGPER
jgi:hypothetical protein